MSSTATRQFTTEPGSTQLFPLHPKGDLDSSWNHSRLEIGGPSHWILGAGFCLLTPPAGLDDSTITPAGPAVTTLPFAMSEGAPR